VPTGQVVLRCLDARRRLAELQKDHGEPKREGGWLGGLRYTVGQLVDWGYELVAVNLEVHIQWYLRALEELSYLGL
jgi:hypothetical protein